MLFDYGIKKNDFFDDIHKMLGFPLPKNHKFT